MTLEIGTLLANRYRITAVIAQGGMGAIYRAHDESLGVEAAVKENLFSSEDSSRQFHREATLLAALRHPNLPRVTDHFVLAGQGQYLVMDYIDGEDIRQRLSRQNISEDEAVSIGVAVCQALSYLHTRVPPVIHRDIKPGNIKITSTGQVFLVDFGLAKISQPGQATTTGAQALTPGYAPPEQYGQGTQPASDIYALGATLYAAMTGKVPEDGLARAMGSATLTPLRVHNPALSERIAQVIERAMAIKPADRYNNAEDFRLALLSISPATRLSSHPASAMPSDQFAVDVTMRSKPLPTIATPQMPPGFTPTPPPSKPLNPPAKKLPIAAIIIGVVVVLALMIGGILIISNNPQESLQPTTTFALPSTKAPSPLPPTATSSPVPATAVPSITPPPATPTVATTSTAAATSTSAATPLGGGSGQIAFVSLRANNLPQIFLANPDGANPSQLTKLPDGACQPDWSPDGKRLVFVSPCRSRQSEYRGSTLYLINADGSNLTPLPSMPGGDFDPAWSPDGKQIAFTSLRESIQHIFLINLSDNKVIRFSAESSFDGKPAWSPDGKLIAFESTRLGTLQIWVAEASGQNTRQFTILPGSVAFNPRWTPDGQNIIFNRDQALPVLWIKQYKDLAPEFKVSEEIRPVENARYSKDGQWIVFENWKSANRDIYRMAFNGSNLTQLTNDPAVDFSPVWRP